MSSIHATSGSPAGSKLPLWYNGRVPESRYFLFHGEGALICPVCRIEMIGVERNGIELDYCISCHGLWFDHGELDLLAELTGADLTRLDTAAAVQSTRRRRCPRCNSQLDEEAIGSLQLDRCPRGDGFWFDHGELGRFVRGGLPDDGSLVPLKSFLGEVFNANSQ